MQHDQRDTLIRMANQIAANLRHGTSDEAAIEGVCRHLRQFWARPMKRRIIAVLDEAEAGLDPLARRAVERLADGRPT